MTSRPPKLVGIAIPSYLGAGIIEHTLRSLVQQSHPGWYCVVVNDGAEDGTDRVVTNVQDPRVRYICDGRRRGQFANFNKAIIEVLKGDPDIIRLLCSDDVLYPHDLADMLRVFSAYPNVGLVATHYDGIDERDGVIFRVDMRGRTDLVMSGSEYLLKGVAVGNTIGGPSSVALRREALDTAGLFDTRINHSGEADLWHRVAADWDIAWVGDRPGLQYRFHDESITGRGKYSVARFTDPIQLVRRVACTEPLFGPRWWVLQYTIGRLHSLNLQLFFAHLIHRRWKGASSIGLAALREGMLAYTPFWLPRVPWQLACWMFGLNPSRRILWHKVHSTLQPATIATSRFNSGDGQELAAHPEGERVAASCDRH